MLAENVIMAMSVILSIVLFTSTTTNAFAISNETHGSDDVEILGPLAGQTKTQNYITGQSVFDNKYSSGPDFFECNEQAEIATSPYTENYRNWEAFFKRNLINDTIAVSMNLKP